MWDSRAASPEKGFIACGQWQEHHDKPSDLWARQQPERKFEKLPAEADQLGKGSFAFTVLLLCLRPRRTVSGKDLLHSCPFVRFAAQLPRKAIRGMGRERPYCCVNFCVWPSIFCSIVPVLFNDVFFARLLATSSVGVPNKRA